jgi:hypothetical protein
MAHMKNRLIDAVKQNTEVRFRKRQVHSGGTHHPVNDLPAHKVAADFAYAMDEQRHAMTMFPESKSLGAALAKWYETPVGKRTISAKLKADYEAGQRRVAAVGNGNGQWAQSAADDSPIQPSGEYDSREPGVSAVNGLMSESHFYDGAVGNGSGFSKEWIGAFGKATMAGVYAAVRKKLVAEGKYPEDWIDSALIRHERGEF